MYTKDLLYLLDLIYFLGPFYPICFKHSLAMLSGGLIFKVNPKLENVHCYLQIER